VTRLFLLGAALLASACSFHTHETVVVQPTQPVYVAAPGHAPRDAVVVNHPGKREPGKRRPVRARPSNPAKPPPRGTIARPDPKPPAGARPQPKPHPRPYVDRKHPPKRKMVVCTREVEKTRKECASKSGHHPLAQKRDG
jgi:hypothetical protein